MISSDTALEIVGEGLPTGQRLVVELRGTLSAVAQDPRAVRVSFVGHVLAPERLSVALDSELLRRWGRAGFDGEVRVSCESNAPRRCLGVLPGVSLDLEAADPRRAQRQRHVVEQLLPAVGLTVSDVESVSRGVLLSAVEPGSLAARAGLRPGDKIVRSNGVSLHALSDLAPGPSASALLLRVERAPTLVEQQDSARANQNASASERRSETSDFTNRNASVNAWASGDKQAPALADGTHLAREVLAQQPASTPASSASAPDVSARPRTTPTEIIRLSLASAAPLSDPRTLGLCLLACPALLLLLGFLPIPLPGAALSRLTARWHTRATRRLVPGALLCLLLSAACVIWRQPPDAFWLLSLQLGCTLALFGLRGARWRRRALDLTGMWLAAACVAAISGTRSWDVIMHDQLGGPWAWNALSRPPLLFALVVTLLHAVRLHAKPAATTHGALLEGASRALVVTLCTGLFLGGSQLHSDASGAALLAACALSSLKALGCYLIMSILPVLPLPGAKRLAILWGTLCATSLLWPWISPSRSFELLLGSALCVFSVFWLAVGLVQLRRSQLQPVKSHAATALS